MSCAAPLLNQLYRHLTDLPRSLYVTYDRLILGSDAQIKTCVIIKNCLGPSAFLLCDSLPVPNCQVSRTMQVLPAGKAPEDQSNRWITPSPKRARVRAWVFFYHILVCRKLDKTTLGMVPPVAAEMSYPCYKGYTVSFQTLFVWAFKIGVDSVKFIMLLVYILWEYWPNFMISAPNEQLQQ